MKPLAFSLAVLAVLCRAIHGAAIDQRAMPKYGDPSLMHMHKDGTRDGINLLTTFVPHDTAEYTCCFWAKIEPWDGATYPMIATQISVEAARSTSEGGEGNPALVNAGCHPDVVDGVPTFTGTPLALSPTGTWSANCLPALYDCPPSLSNTWKYGCYTVQVLTDSDLTITVAGAERNASASNGVQTVCFRGVSADRSITVAAASADAEVYLDAGENKLRQFFEANTLGMSQYNTEQVAWSNEWTFVALRARVAGGNCIQRIQAWRLAGYDPCDEACVTQALASVRGTFAKDARIGFTLSALGGLKQTQGGDTLQRWTWGAKFYPEWLDDEMLLAIRDQDRPYTP